MYNGIIVIDKPAGMTSHDVVSRMRRILGQKRVGHGGTLDPMATGVLPVFFGRSTHAAGYILDGGKVYAAKMKLGITTDTQDTTGTVLTEKPVTCGFDEVKAAAESFIGEIDQIPPMYSAISQNGVRLYKLARKGVEVEREPRKVTVYSIDVKPCGEDEYEVTVACSKGLYIRTLLADIGEKLGCGAAMSALRRVKAGPFDESMALTLEQVQELKENGGIEEHIRRADILYEHLDKFIVPQNRAVYAKNGGKINCKLPDGDYRMYIDDGEFAGIGTVTNGIMHLTIAFFDE